MIIRVSLVLEWLFEVTLTDVLTTWAEVIIRVKMSSAQVVQTSVNGTSNSPSQDYTHPDDHNLRIYDMTPGFKPLRVFLSNLFSADSNGTYSSVMQ